MIKKILLFIFKPSEFGALYRPCTTCRYSKKSSLPNIGYLCTKFPAQKANTVTGEIKISYYPCSFNRGLFGECGERGHGWRRAE